MKNYLKLLMIMNNRFNICQPKIKLYFKTLFYNKIKIQKD